MDSVSWGLESGECLDQHPVEVVYDAAMLEENGILSPLFAGGVEEWSRVGHVGGQWLRSEGPGFGYQQQQPLSPLIHYEQHPTHINPFHPTPIESFHGGYDYQHVMANIN
jgi:hypothetical protein